MWFSQGTFNVLSRLINSVKKGLDNPGLVGTILMDLSKAYECLRHNFFIVKLEPYGLDKPSLNLVNSYLRLRKQRKKLGSSYSDWANVTKGFPQRSILAPVLSNIFTNDFFLFIEKYDIQYPL